MQTKASESLDANLAGHLACFTDLSEHGEQGASWCALNLKTGKSISHNSRRFLAASTIKLPILAVYAEQRSQPVFQTPYTYNANDNVEDSPFFDKADPAKPIDWDTLAHWMMILSDNAATNLLIHKLGLKNIQQWIENKGFKETVLARTMMDLKARSEGRENWTTPLDMQHFMVLLVQEKLLTAKATQWMLAILHRCEDPEKIPFLFRRPVAVANKPGELPGLRADVGYVHDPKNEVVMSLFCDGVPESQEEACDLWQAELAQKLWRHLT